MTTELVSHEVTLATHGQDGTARRGDVIVAVSKDSFDFLIGSTIVETSVKMGLTHLTVLRGPGFLLYHGHEWNDCVGLKHLTVERVEEMSSTPRAEVLQ